MATTFRPDAKRDAAAQEIAQGAQTWLQIRLRRQHGAFSARTKFYGVPSSKADGSYYYTNLKACSCADYQRRGAGCKHQRAVALHVERVRAGQRQSAQQAEQQGERQSAESALCLPAPAPTRGACMACGGALPPDLVVGLCTPCVDTDVAFALVLGGNEVLRQQRAGH